MSSFQFGQPNKTSPNAKQFLQKKCATIIKNTVKTFDLPIVCYPQNNVNKDKSSYE